MRQPFHLDLNTITARDLALAVQEGRIDSRDITQCYLDYIAALEPQLQAFICHDAQFARAQAQGVMAQSLKGVLAGVPLGVKDVIETAQLPTAYGSKAYPNFQPCRDAPVVHLARKAGAVVMGKTVSTEFATAAPGATVNPFDHSRTPGGSSSGSAAGLAAGLFLLAYGTQTSGSTIRPASYCGVVGYKASAGLIDKTGVKPISGTLDVVGLLARDCRDLALLAGVAARRPILGALAYEHTPALPRLGLFLPQDPDVASDHSNAIAQQAAGVLGGVRDVAIPAWWHGLGRAQAAVFGWEVSACLAVDRDEHWDQLASRSHAFLTEAAKWSFGDWCAGLATKNAALADLERLFGEADILITQAAPGEAPLGLQATGPAAYNIRWSLLGCPALSVPAGLGPNGMPIGIQLVARPGEDAALLATAIAVEARLRQANIMARPDLMPLQKAS